MVNFNGNFHVSYWLHFLEVIGVMQLMKDFCKVKPLYLSHTFVLGQNGGYRYSDKTHLCG